MLGLDELKAYFVDPFAPESSRHDLYKGLESYLADFSALVTPNFRVWINGSFVSTKISPRDIDLVTIVEAETAVQKAELLSKRFLNEGAEEFYGIDAYLVRLYPEAHKDYNKSLSDRLYWEHWFGYTRKNRVKKRFAKGFVELLFNEQTHLQ